GGSQSCATTLSPTKTGAPPNPCSGYLLFIQDINDSGRIIERRVSVERDLTGQDQIQLFRLDDLLNGSVHTGLGLLQDFCLSALDRAFQLVLHKGKLFGFFLQLQAQASPFGLTENRGGFL